MEPIISWKTFLIAGVAGFVGIYALGNTVIDVPSDTASALLALRILLGLGAGIVGLCGLVSAAANGEPRRSLAHLVVGAYGFLACVALVGETSANVTIGLGIAVAGLAVSCAWLSGRSSGQP